jgi:hypothetical protein
MCNGSIENVNDAAFKFLRYPHFLGNVEGQFVRCSDNTAGHRELDENSSQNLDSNRADAFGLGMYTLIQ